MNPLFATMPVSIFETMSLASVRHGAVNLGQGFPDFGWPEPLLDEAARLLREGSNQYPPSRGLASLRTAVAAHYGRHQGLSLTAENILVTSGATEAIAATILALVEDGDEVVIMTPAYDAYAPMVRRAGGRVREVALRPPLWKIERAALEAAIGPATRLLILNNPHNPTGRLFNREELEIIADVARENDLLVLSDEVWEHVLLGSSHFTALASLPDMSGRVLKFGSAGKMYSLTGWKVGWLIGPPALVETIAKAHQYLTFATPPNLQGAVAFALDEGDRWLKPMRAAFTRARDRLTAGLETAGYSLLPSAATYFQCVDLAASGIDLDDLSFADHAVAHAGVAVIPLSPFSQSEPVTTMIRLCFAKRDETIDAGIAALARAKAELC